MHSTISKRASVCLLIVLTSILSGAITTSYAQTATQMAPELSCLWESQIIQVRNSTILNV